MKNHFDPFESTASITRRQKLGRPPRQSRDVEGKVRRIERNGRSCLSGGALKVNLIKREHFWRTHESHHFYIQFLCLHSSCIAKQPVLSSFGELKLISVSGGRIDSVTVSGQ